MRDPEALQAALFRLIAEKLHVEVASPEADLIEIGVLDSLAFVTLIAHIEEDFGVTVPMDDFDVENFRSVARMTAYLGGRLLTPAA